MNLIRRKVFSLLTEAAYKEIEALGPQSPYAKELNEIEDINTIIAEEIEKICNTATLAEITKVFSLVRRLKKAPVHKREIIKSELNSIAENLMKKVETKSDLLKLPQCCRHILLGIFSSA